MEAAAGAGRRQAGIRGNLWQRQWQQQPYREGAGLRAAPATTHLPPPRSPPAPPDTSPPPTARTRPPAAATPAWAAEESPSRPQRPPPPAAELRRGVPSAACGPGASSPERRSCRWLPPASGCSCLAAWPLARPLVHCCGPPSAPPQYATPPMRSLTAAKSDMSVAGGRSAAVGLGRRSPLQGTMWGTDHTLCPLTGATAGR